MNRKLCVLSSVLLASYSVSNADGSLAVNKKTSCEENGGKVIELTPLYQEASGKRSYGMPKLFCQFNRLNWGGLNEIIGLDSFEASQPNYAATFVQKLRIWPNQLLPVSPYTNPALNLCQRLNGTEMTFFDDFSSFADKEKNELDICIFGDGSSISAWTLAYAARFSHLSKLRKLVNSEPMNLKIPKIVQ